MGYLRPIGRSAYEEVVAFGLLLRVKHRAKNPERPTPSTSLPPAHQDATEPRSSNAIWGAREPCTQVFGDLPPLPTPGVTDSLGTH